MKKIIIIGGGIAGLSAGIYARQAGFECNIYEKHNITGGQCTGWTRQGYHIDGCIHWLTGTKEGSDLHKVWQNVDALNNQVEIIQFEEFGTYELCGAKITLWKDLERLKSELIQLSTEDKSEITEFINDIKAVQTLDMPAKMPVDMLSIKELVQLGKSMKSAGGVMSKNGKISCEEYAKRFKHPALRKMFSHCMPQGYSIAAFIFSLGTFSSGNGAVPRGGSLAMAKRMEERFKAIGGKIVISKPVTEIVVMDNIARGIQFADGTFEGADYVIAACDAKITFEQLLKGRYKDKKFEMRYNNTVDYALPTSVMIAFGVSKVLADYPTVASFETETYRVGVTDYDITAFKNYTYEPEFAPKGNTVITTNITQTDSDYLYWEKLHKNPEEYQKEKMRVATELQTRIEDHFPELKGKLTLLDVATPATYHRYTGAYHGAWMSFMMSANSKSMMHKGEIKGLKNCLLTGQWLQPPGGLPVAVVTGKFTIQRICKKEKMNYNV
ncbi:MAG: FAD-dependent oxidoreductase [Anaerocolumna sp.]